QTGNNFSDQMFALVLEYINALENYYNTGDETVFNYTDGEVENTLKNNYKSGSFSNYENLGVTNLSVGTTMDEDVFVEVERKYSHASSGGVQSSVIEYHLIDEKIVGWEE